MLICYLLSNEGGTNLNWKFLEMRLQQQGLTNYCRAQEGGTEEGEKEVGSLLPLRAFPPALGSE